MSCGRSHSLVSAAQVSDIDALLAAIKDIKDKRLVDDYVDGIKKMVEGTMSYESHEKLGLDATFQQQIAIIARLYGDKVTNASLMLDSIYLFQSPSFITKLIQLGGNVNDVCDLGYPVLYHAVKYNQLAIVRILLAAGANPSTTYYYN
jgi:hypothetical protein